MPLQLFTHAPHSYAQDEIGKRGDYNHRFGGDAIQFGYRFHDCKPLHLIYELDQSDPLCPSYLTGQSSLPLFYPFRYEQGCTYEVRGQDIRIVGPSWLSDSFPPWDAPETFPELPTRLCSMPYDPSDPQDVMAFKGVFGWDSLDEAGIKDALAIGAKHPVFILRHTRQKTHGPTSKRLNHATAHRLFRGHLSHAAKTQNALRNG